MEFTDQRIEELLVVYGHDGLQLGNSSIFFPLTLAARRGPQCCRTFYFPAGPSCMPASMCMDQGNMEDDFTILWQERMPLIVYCKKMVS